MFTKNKAVVTFMDSNTRSLKREFVDKNGSLPVEFVVPTPTKPKSTLNGWVSLSEDYDLGTVVSDFSSVTFASDAIYVAKYSVTNTVANIDVTINGVTTKYNSNDVVECTLPEGHVAWRDAETNLILSYEQTYKFTVLGKPRKIISDADTLPKTKHVSLYYEGGLSKTHAYVGHFEGYESVLEYGFVYTEGDVDVYKNLHNYNPETNEFLMSTNDQYINIRAYVKYLEAGVEETDISVVTYKTHTIRIDKKPYATDNFSIKLIGTMTGWQKEQALTFTEVGSYLEVSFKIDYAAGIDAFKVYLDRGQEDWADHQAANSLTETWDNFNLTKEYLLDRPSTMLNITNWKGLVTIRLTSVPSTTGEFPVKLLGTMTNWETNPITFVMVDGVRHATFIYTGTDDHAFKVCLDKGGNIWDHPIAGLDNVEWGNYGITVNDFIGKDNINIDVPKWKDIP